MAVVKIDGSGVFPDAPLPDGYRFRVSLTGNPSEDVAVYVEEGRLHVVGHYVVVAAERIQPNHMALDIVPLADPR